MNKCENEQTTILGIKEIRRILPHRYPFLLLDRVIELDLENNSIIGLKCVTVNEPFFNGHFPDAPIMPGVLILEALALTEIMIDFTDQEVPEDTCYEIDRVLRILLKNLNQELGRYKTSELVRDGFDITIIGKPNVGKSSLLNYIAGKERAIVSEVAGTTRDIIELSIDLKGYRVNFFDTAGIHETKDSIELIGIDRAKTKAKNSDMRIFLLENNDLVKNFGLEIKSDDLVFNAKSDLFNSTKKAGISGKTGDGVNKMLDIVFQKIKNKTRYNSVLINERHKNIIEITISSLTSAQEELKRTNVQIEIVAELLRSSITQLDLLIGKINVEDILGAIFSSFCIGK